MNRRTLLATSAAAAAFAPAMSRPQTMTRGTTMPQSPVRDHLESCLERIHDPRGAGLRACITVYAEKARAAADAADARARSGQSLGPLVGKVVAVKDLFDIPG